MLLGLDQGMSALVWRLLGWGKLTGKIRRNQPAQPGSRAHDVADTGPQFEEERLFRILDALDAAAETGRTVPKVALSWLLRRPTISTVIVGARNEEQPVQNIGDVAPASPVQHQRGFPMLNERAGR